MQHVIHITSAGTLYANSFFQNQKLSQTRFYE